MTEHELDPTAPRSATNTARNTSHLAADEVLLSRDAATCFKRSRGHPEPGMTYFSTMYAQRSAISPQGMGALPVAVLLLASVFAQLGIWPAHVLQRWMIREGMEQRLVAGLPDSALTTLHFSVQEWACADFADEGKEVVVAGVQYDIARVIVEDSGVSCMALRDDEETQLVQELDRLLRNVDVADTQGRSQRARSVELWAPFCEAQGSVSIPNGAHVTMRCFSEQITVTGRTPEAVDPGPPRA
jgi:hypothetical protein